ncbi:MAG: histidine kinase [Imperialibacter sp.]|uniref:histidine kinase n=1 Tax=Imperialibacter sp. TaxID=2038411 RepID=UPI0032EC66D1
MKYFLLAALSFMSHCGLTQAATQAIDRANTNLEGNRRDSVKVYAKQIMEYGAKEEIDSLAAIGKYFLAEGILYEDPAESLTLASSAFEVFIKTKMKLYAARAKKSIGNSYKLLSKYEESVAAFKEAMQLLDGNQSSAAVNLGAIINYGIGAALRDNAQYREAITYLQKTDSIAERIPNPSVQISALIQIAAIFFEVKDFEKAKSYFLQAEQMAADSAYSNLRYFITNGLAHVYREENQLDSALLLFQKAYLGSKDIHDEVNAAVYLFNIADLLMEIGLVDSAKVVNDEMMAVSEKIGLTENIAFGHEINSRFFIKKNRPKEAVKSALQSLEISKQIGDPEQLIRARKNLFEIYREAGHFDMALDAYLKYDVLTDSLELAQNMARIEELQTEYETSKKDRSILQLQQQNEIQELQLSRRNLLLIVVAVVLVGIIVVGVLFYRQRNLRKDKEANDLKQKLLRVQLNPHFMFNSLNAIQNLVFKNTDRQRTADYLARFSQLTRQILELNRRDFISLEDEIKFIENYIAIQQLRFDEPFQHELSVDSEVESNELLIPPMITQPFLENAIEHGIMNKQGDGKIAIKFSSTATHLQILIEDNGVGRDQASFNQRNKAHRSLATQITIDRLANMEKSFKKRAVMDINDIVKEGLVCGTKVFFELPLTYAQ